MYQHYYYSSERLYQHYQNLQKDCTNIVCACRFCSWKGRECEPSRLETAHHLSAPLHLELCPHTLAALVLDGWCLPTSLDLQHHPGHHNAASFTRRRGHSQRICVYMLPCTLCGEEKESMRSWSTWLGEKMFITAHLFVCVCARVCAWLGTEPCWAMKQFVSGAPLKGDHVTLSTHA